MCFDWLQGNTLEMFKGHQDDYGGNNHRYYHSDRSIQVASQNKNPRRVARKLLAIIVLATMNVFSNELGRTKIPNE